MLCISGSATVARCLSEAHGQNSHAGGRGSSSTDDDSGRPQITAPDGTTRTAPVPVSEREPPILVNNFQHTISEDVRPSALSAAVIAYAVILFVWFACVCCSTIVLIELAIAWWCQPPVFR